MNTNKPSSVFNKDIFWQEYFSVKDNLINEDSSSYTSVRKRLRKVEKLVFKFRDSLVEKEVLDNISSSHSKLTQKAYEIGEVYLEGSLREFILKKRGQDGFNLSQTLEMLKKAPPVRRTFKYAGKEVIAAGVNKSSKFIHVGMGSLPETLLGIYDNKKDLPVMYGADVDIKAVEEAQILLNSLSLNKKMHLIHSNGSELDYQSFSHILVAVLVRPELETIEQICKTASKTKQVKVLLRTVSGLGTMIYKPVSNRSIKTLKKYGFIQTDLVKGHVVMNTMIFTRNALS